ncbi:class I SAM-dependent methyltransferase [Mycolicibacterium fortuitum]|uniref:class I SAM-dependent methyltransferase n=1 Tax=Mycolicibacterium fortuitum TaxID=1766 RepID=UPI00094411E4
MLEVGPGPGLTTELLRLDVGHLTAVELDADLAADLATRLAGTNVEVINGDATELPFDDQQFTAVVSCNMLHHIPTVDLQKSDVRRGRPRDAGRRPLRCHRLRRQRRARGFSP